MRPPRNFCLQGTSKNGIFIFQDQKFVEKSDNFEKDIKNIYSFFEKKISNPRELTPIDIQHLSNYIRPNIDLVPKLKTSIDETNLRLVKGTNEQYSVLSSALENERILCTGGGGTGKTLLAIEIAKRGHFVYVLTRANNEKVIFNFFKDTPKPENIEFIYYDLPSWVLFFKKGALGVNLYYFLWQLSSYYFIVKKQKLFHCNPIH